MKNKDKHTFNEAFKVAKQFYYDWFREDSHLLRAAIPPPPRMFVEAIAALLLDVENGRADWDAPQHSWGCSIQHRQVRPRITGDETE